jgi:hypothetical protein
LAPPTELAPSVELPIDEPAGAPLELAPPTLPTMVELSPVSLPPFSLEHEATTASIEVTKRLAESNARCRAGSRKRNDGAIALRSYLVLLPGSQVEPWSRACFCSR